MEITELKPRVELLGRTVPTGIGMCEGQIHALIEDVELENISKEEFEEQLLDLLGDISPESIVAVAAKLCYSPADIDHLFDGLTYENVKRRVDGIISMGHESPIEHINFTFAIEGVSRTMTHQLVRHRIASYSQQSQRYVTMGRGENAEVIIPEQIKNNKEALEIYLDAVEHSFNAYNQILDLLASDAGIDKPMEKQKEDAREILPNACGTRIIVTMNARTLLHFFKVRCCERAQWQIRDVAWQMLEIVEEIAPEIFKNAGPACVKGKCPEGEKTCGNPKRKIIQKG